MWHVVATAKHMYASSWRLCIGAMSTNMVRTMQQKLLAQVEKGQSMCRPSEKIFRYPH